MTDIMEPPSNVGGCSYFTRFLSALTRTKSIADSLSNTCDEKLLDGEKPKSEMKRVLSLWDVVAFGIGLILSYANTGAAVRQAGPAVLFSFGVAAVASLMSAFAYMEFAARVPVAGSAYTFAYVCLGELTAWFVGWNLSLEYAISSALVARSFSSNLAVFVNTIWYYPPWLNSIPVNILGFSVSLSVMSLFVCLFCTAVLLAGAKESSTMNIILTILNVAVIFFVIGYGSTFVDEHNWIIAEDVGHEKTFFPHGLNGVMTGGSIVFFSYIGFDGVTVLAEEVKNPTRDIPLGIIISLTVTTLMYLGTAVVLTGMVPWFTMNEESPLPSTFDAVGPKWSTAVLGCATAISSAQLVLVGLFAQPRIFYRMARDGLLGSWFGKLHHGSPIFGTVFAGVAAGLLSLVMNLEDLSNMISIGTLMAFSTVCAGVVTLRYQFEPQLRRIPIDDLGSPLLGVVQEEEENIPTRRNPAVWWLLLYTAFCLGLGLCIRHREHLHFTVLISMAILCLVPPTMISRLPQPSPTGPPLNFMCPLVPWLPCLGIFVNVYLMASLDSSSYIRVAVWTGIGMANYFLYGISHSVLNKDSRQAFSK